MMASNIFMDEVHSTQAPHTAHLHTQFLSKRLLVVQALHMQDKNENNQDTRQIIAGVRSNVKEESERNRINTHTHAQIHT